MKTPTHPDRSQLNQFAAGSLDDTAFEEVAAHVEQCDLCAAALDKYRIALREQDTAAPLSESVGTVVGPYKLLQLLGEGGMGAVYMAEQQEPVRRMVAVKIIKPGMDSRQVIARFEAERQTLAMMDHQHIARVLDAGTTDAGRPYFVMELVRGIPITAYCDQNQLTPRARLELFLPICRAIQHAHQKGIIHRDIKPTNVLVALHDGVPIPKVIDFGIAKATQQRVTEKTMFTEFGQLLGTAEYMSPEQAELNQLDIDTRSDIYSLGVLLYELLTGSTPLTNDDLRVAGFEGMLRALRETEPPKPSTRISDSGLALASISQARKMEPDKLSRFVRGDLDWIVMKALEKDRTRRYETANGLAADLVRFLADEPVVAGPPSATYRFRKFAKRNRILLSTAAAVTLLLVMATSLSVSLAVWAIRAEERASIRAADARIAAKAAEEQRRLAEDNARVAAREASRSEQTATFLKNMLEAVGPSVALGRDTKLLKEILDKTAERIEADLRDQPEVEAELRTTLGRVYHDLGVYSESEAMHRRALELRQQLHPDGGRPVIESLNYWGEALSHQLKSSQAKPVHESALQIARDQFGAEHTLVIMSLQRLGLAHLGLDDSPKAEALLREAAAMQRRMLGDKSSELAVTLGYLASSLANQGQYAAGEEVCREVLAIRKKTLGEKHPEVAQVLNQLSYMLGNQHKYDESEQVYRQTLALQREILGDEHPKTVMSFANMGAILLDRGKEEEAEQFISRAYELSLKSDEPNFETLGTGLVYARMLDRRGEHDEAVRLARQGVARIQAAFGADSVFVVEPLSLLGDLLWNLEKYDEADATYRDSLAIARNHVPEDEDTLTRAFNRLSSLLFSQRQLTDLELLHRERLQRMTSLHGDEHLRVDEAVAGLTWALGLQAKHDEAVAVHRARLASAEQRVGTNHPTFAKALVNLAEASEFRGQYVQAETHCRLALSLDPGVLGEDHPVRLQASTLLGNLLQHRGKIDEAITWQSRVAEHADDQGRAALALLWAGRHDDHQSLCQRVLDRAESSDQQSVRDRAALCVLINPQSRDELVARATGTTRSLQRLDEMSAVDRLWSQCTLGLQSYRLVNDAAADSQFQVLLTANDRDLRVIAWSFAALSALRQGDFDAAAQRHQHAIEEADLLAEMELPSPFEIPVNKLAAWLAIRELRDAFAAAAMTRPGS